MAYVILSTPRTGSTYIVDLIYYCKREPQHLITEYFNLAHTIIDNGKFLRQKSFTHPEFLVLNIKNKKEIKRRIKLLEKYNNKYHVKIHSYQMNNSIYDFLIRNDYKWIMLERKDIYDQLLSYLIAIKTRHWDSVEPSETPKIRNICIKKSLVYKFFDHLNLYYDFKKEIDFFIPLFYEDILDNSVFRKLELEPTKFKSTIKLYSKEEKEKAIVNIDQVKWWFKGGIKCLRK